MNNDCSLIFCKIRDVDGVKIVLWLGAVRMGRLRVACCVSW